MRALDISRATESLSTYAKSVRRQPVIVTRRGKPVAALLPIENADVETVTLSTHPKFLALIERARVRHKREEGIKSKELRRRLGFKPVPSKSRVRANGG